MRIEIKGAIIPNDDKWIYDWCELDSTSPQEVNDIIANADGEDLDVYINSGGGDIFAGSEIYSALREYSGRVNIHIVGLAASAASVIACAGKCDISPTAMMMLHNVSSGVRGDYHAMDKESGILQTANKAIATAYMKKCGISEPEALALMDRETWLSASEAVEIGIADRIAESQNLKLVAAFGNLIPQNVIEKIRARFSNADYEREKLNLLKLKGDFKNDF